VSYEELPMSGPEREGGDGGGPPSGPTSKRKPLRDAQASDQSFYSPPRTIPPSALVAEEDEGPKVVIAASADPRRAPTMPLIRFRAPPLPPTFAPPVTPFAMPPAPPPAVHAPPPALASDRPPGPARNLPPAVAVPPRRVAPVQPPGAKLVLFIGVFLFLATMGLVTLLVLRARGTPEAAPPVGAPSPTSAPSR
jgi:hypothetical protein